MRKPITALSICFMVSCFGLTLNNHVIGQASAFTGTPLVQCSDDYSVRDPFRVVNTVEADTSKPGFMLLKFDSQQGVYPFDGIVTVNWRNLSSNMNGHFQEQRVNNRYSIAAVPAGPGTIALSVRFDNTLSGSYNKILPTAQCNATLEVISSQAAISTIPNPAPVPTAPTVIANPIAVSKTITSGSNPLPVVTPLPAITPLSAVKPLPAITPLGAIKPLPAITPMAPHADTPVISPSTPQKTAIWSAPIPVGNTF